MAKASKKYMQQGIESTPLPLDVESSFEDSFALVSPFRSDGFDGERIVFVGESNVERSECYKFQPLPSPFGLSLELDMEQEFFRTDFDEDCKVVGPTLAELNDHRSLSPLINPEMERLHRIAMRTEGDVLFSSGYTPRRPQAYIALEHSVERTGKPIIQVKKESLDSSSECCERHGNPRGVVNERVPREVSCSAPTWTVTHSSTGWRGNDATKETSSTEDGRSRHKFTLEEKLENEVIDQVPTLGSTQMKDDISSESAKNGTIKTEEISTEHDSCATDPGSPAVDDESGEEEMESDEDFEVEDHSQESGLVRNRKGRRGESDDLSPNPRKLLEISRELDRLNKVIGDLKPINKLPQNARNKSRKEKNKLASRACRLKKKAQHEANKVKLHGLELEQQRLTEVIDKVKKEILKGSSKPVVQRGSLSSHVEGLIKATFGNQLVAGHTSDFVHSVLKATARSNPSMEGLGELSMCF